MNRKILRYFNTHKLIGGLIIASFGSLFIYLTFCECNQTLIETLFGISFFLMLITSESRLWWWSGFFIGILWFWWIGVSFYYYGAIWIMPLAWLGVAFSFGGLFWFGARVSEIINKILKIENLDTIFKAVYLFVLSYIHPLGFNWFKPELILVHSPFGIDKPHFALFLAGMVLFLILKSKQKMVSLIFFIFSISPSNYQILPQEPEGKIYLETTWIDVRDKWKVDKIPFQIRDVLVAIDRAIANKKEAIILPESILPFFINESKIMLKELRYRSKDIDIILGGLYKNANENRNSLYFFHKGNFLVSDKVVLVPFGESNPLPDWASGWVNRLFFDGAPDYTPAKKPTDFRIAGKVYRGAICYEGTSDEIYQNIPKRLILISNNGWFYPSIEPTLQRLLLEYYVRTYHVRVYHSINYSKSYVIIPKDDKR